MGKTLLIAYLTFWVPMLENTQTQSIKKMDQSEKNYEKGSLVKSGFY